MLHFYGTVPLQGRYTRVFEEVGIAFQKLSRRGWDTVGRGHGIEFATALNDNLGSISFEFDKQTISKSPHLEKVCLIRDNTGRDSISDFVTNLIKKAL